MKNLKLMLLSVTALLFLGMGAVNAQTSSVMVSGYVEGKPFSVSVVHPDYEKTEKKYDGKDKDFHVVLKEELDKWLRQGYEIIDSSTASGPSAVYRVTYVLTKKD